MNGLLYTSFMKWQAILESTGCIIQSGAYTIKPPKWQLQVEKGFILSTSIHDITQLPELKHFDYAFYGPVFDSISKPGYQSKLSADFKLDKTDIKPKVIALGGIQIANLTMNKPMGFDGAAVLGIVWNEPNKAVKHYNQLKETLPV
jgi:thiamine-phosphate pyrophosphorylase